MRALAFFGGSPAALVPDNLKSGVDRAHRYDPDLNRAYAEFAEHYGLGDPAGGVRPYLYSKLPEVDVSIHIGTGDGKAAPLLHHF